MINLYNYVIFIISRHISNLFSQKKVGVFNLLINLSIGNFKYSKYGVKLVNRDIKENTYRFCLGAAYGESYSKYLKLISDRFIFLDIGSNIGLYSCIASQNENCQYTYSFEPISFLSSIIKKNYKINSVKGKVLNFGINKNNNFCKVYYNPNHTGMSSVLRHKNIYYKRVLKCRFVDRNSLNRVFNKKFTNYIVKIDVEGLEKIVINELLNSNISKLISSIFVEIDSKKNFYIINKMLKKKNFKIIKNFKTNLTKDYLFIKK